MSKTRLDNVLFIAVHSNDTAIHPLNVQKTCYSFCISSKHYLYRTGADMRECRQCRCNPLIKKYVEWKYSVFTKLVKNYKKYTKIYQDCQLKHFRTPYIFFQICLSSKSLLWYVVFPFSEIRFKNEFFKFSKHRNVFCILLGCLKNIERPLQDSNGESRDAAHASSYITMRWSVS